MHDELMINAFLQGSQQQLAVARPQLSDLIRRCVRPRGRDLAGCLIVFRAAMPLCGHRVEKRLEDADQEGAL